MRIFFASDLHFDAHRGRGGVEAMARWLDDHATSDDVLVLGGDYGNDDATVAACLELYANFPGSAVGVTGNHDIWVQTGDPRDDENDREQPRDSRRRWKDVQDLLADAGIHPLERGPMVVGDTAFCGALGWYDYSFRVRGLGVDMEVYRDKRLPEYRQPVWKDAFHARWPGMSDPEVTDWQLQRLEGHLRDAADSARRLVVALHHVPTERLLRPDWLPEFLPRHYLIPEKWLVLNTYLGSQRFADLLAGFSDKIDVAFCGHIHLARTSRNGGVRYIANGSTYQQKELTIWENDELTRKTFGE